MSSEVLDKILDHIGAWEELELKTELWLETIMFQMVTQVELLVFRHWELNGQNLLKIMQ